MGNKVNKEINIKSNNKTKKIVIKDKNKFYKAISIFVIILALIFVVCIFSNRNIKIDNDTNIQKINIKKYSSEVKLYYEGLLNEFITDHNNIQNLAWTYIYNNLVDGKTMDSLINEVNQIFESGDLAKIGIEENTKWRGAYRIDKNSNVLLFKFEIKQIEPTWIDDSSVSYMIEKN